MSATRWSPATAAAAIAFLVIAALQIGLPIRAIFDERPARYGWQMYSTVSQAPEVWTEDADGRLVAVDALAVMGDPRAEIRWADLLAERLCRGDAVTAVIVWERGEQERRACP